MRSWRFSTTVGSGWWFGKVPSLSQKSPVHSCDERADAVAAIDDDLEPALQLPRARDDVLDVAVDDRLRAHGALPRGKRSGDGELVQLLNLVAVNRLGAERELEAVVLRRVVRAGHLYAADHVEVIQRPVEQRRRHLSNVDDVEPALREPAHERVAQLATARPVVAADQVGCIRAAERVRRVRGEIAADDAAHIILTKDFPAERHLVPRYDARPRGRPRVIIDWPRMPPELSPVHLPY